MVWLEPPFRTICGRQLPVARVGGGSVPSTESDGLSGVVLKVVIKAERKASR